MGKQQEYWDKATEPDPMEGTIGYLMAHPPAGSHRCECGMVTMAAQRQCAMCGRTLAIVNSPR